MIGYGDREVDMMHEIEDKEYLDWEGQMADNERFIVAKEKWEGKLNDLNTSEGGIYVFPQPGSTKCRILLSPEREPADFYTPVIRMFRGKTRTQFMMPVIVYENDTWSEEPKYLVCAKTVMQGILELLVEGYDLIHPRDGHGIVINRTGEGLQTKYNVLPSKNVIPVDYSQYAFEQELQAVVDELEASDREDQMPEVDEIPF